MSTLGIVKPTLDPHGEGWRRRIIDAILYLYEKLQEVASTTPAISGVSSGALADNAVIRGDGTSGNLQGSRASIDDTGNLVLFGTTLGTDAVYVQLKNQSSSSTGWFFLLAMNNRLVVRDVATGVDVVTITQGTSGVSMAGALAVTGYLTGSVNVIGLTTIVSGAIALPAHTLPGKWKILLDAETGVADDLDTISGSVDGDEVTLHSSDTITLTQNGNFRVGPFGKFPLKHAADKATLISDGANFDATSLRNNA